MRKRMLAIVLGVLVFSLVAASAASLGGLNVADVGADTAVVASCNQGDTDGVDVEFTTALGTTEYEVTEVVLSSIDGTDCDGLSVTVALFGPGGTELFESDGSDTVAAGGATITVPSGSVTAEQLRRVSVLISG